MSLLPILADIVTGIFFLTLISYYVLVFLPRRPPKVHKRFRSISIIIPAHNESEFIEACIRSVKDADFDGKKQIIVVDDGSVDDTASKVRTFQDVKLIRTRHSGKSASINRAMKHATGELVAVVDADSEISRDALVETSKEVGRKNVVATACVVKVKNRNRLLCIWPHLELLYNSLIRSVFSKINANITTPGPLSVYRKDKLMEIGGFSTEGFSEDVDVTIRLIRKGYRIGFAEKAVALTNMPYDLKGFLRQRTRFARGLINILKRHMQLNTTIIDIYTLPLFLFSYVQAVIMGFFTMYQIFSGYYRWFLSKGIIMSWDAASYFLDWTSIIGTAKWTYSVLSGQTQITLFVLIGVVATLLSYPLFLYSILKYDRRLDLLHIIPLMFMAPFWWGIMIIYILCLPEMLMKKQHNIWKKNE